VEQDARHSQFSYVHNLTPVEREKSPRLWQQTCIFVQHRCLDCSKKTSSSDNVRVERRCSGRALPSFFFMLTLVYTHTQRARERERALYFILCNIERIVTLILFLLKCWDSAVLLLFFKTKIAGERSRSLHGSS
jgi:hypothetical protein